MDLSLDGSTLHYQPWIDREELVPSLLGALIPGGIDVPTAEQVLVRLRDAGLELLEPDVRWPDPEDPSGWKVDVLVVRDGTPTPYSFAVLPSPVQPPAPAPTDLDDGQRALADASRWSIVVKTDYDRDAVLSAFHHHLRVAFAAMPDAVSFYDDSCLSFRTADWVRRAASSPAPPPLESLFVIHAVGPDDLGGVWLHTHGLDRCGALELEIVGLREDHFSAYGALLNVAASRFVEPPSRPPGHVVTVGSGLAVTWVPWESLDRVFGELPAGMIGGPDDHTDEHGGPRASLLAALGDEGEPAEDVAPLHVFAEALAGEPLFYLSTMETDRMRILARAELPRFAQLLGRYADDEGWAFLAKLGYPVVSDDGDDDGPADGREHLWFQVHAMDADTVEATLINEPYAVELRKGDRATHPLAHLSDLRVHSPYGSYGPDAIGDLVLRVSTTDPA